MQSSFDPNKIQVGISACLLGQAVRYDGGHKRSTFCTDTLGEHVEYVPVCPEVGAGLGLPRPTIRLQQSNAGIRAMRSDGLDVTEPLAQYSEQAAGDLEHLSGYIFCARSPSCGMERVKVYNDKGYSRADGIGLFARSVMQQHPNLPVEENGRLNDLTLRENFVTRLYAYHQWRTLKHAGIAARNLIDFHARHKYLLLAHHPHSYSLLGRLLSDLSGDLQQICEQYEQQFMLALKHIATRSKHCNVLQHIHGYFKDHMNTRQRAELASLIENYRIGLLPLHAPLTLIQHYLAEFPNEYIEQQVYLDPYPQELALRYGI